MSQVNIKTIGELVAILSGFDPKLPVMIETFNEDEEHVCSPITLLDLETRCDDEECLYIGGRIEFDDDKEVAVRGRPPVEEP